MARLRGPIPPGAYTLSLQVRGEGTPRLRLQLLDAANNGALADYHLPAEMVSPTAIGDNRTVDGMIEKVDGWYRLSLTSRLESPEARVIIQLLARNGAGHFAPRNEVVRVRGLQLEGGQSPSAYRPGSEPSGPGSVRGNGTPCLSRR